MFNNKDNEADFCESYKSQILGNNETEKENSLFSTIVKLLTILILLAIIIGVSFYGYNYFMNNQKMNTTTLPPVSMQVSDDDLVVTMAEETEPEKEIIIKKEIVIKKEERIAPPLIITSQIEEEDIDKIANNVKIAIAKSEEKEENETNVEEKIVSEIKNIEDLNNNKIEVNLEVPISAPEAKYLEDLADLSKEIDKERNQ